MIISSLETFSLIGVFKIGRMVKVVVLTSFLFTHFNLFCPISCVNNLRKVGTLATMKSVIRVG